MRIDLYRTVLALALSAICAGVSHAQTKHQELVKPAMGNSPAQARPKALPLPVSAQTAPNAPAAASPAPVSMPSSAPVRSQPHQVHAVEPSSQERAKSERHFQEIENYNEQTQKYEALIRMLQKQREKVALDEEISRAQGNNSQGTRGLPALVGVTGSDRLTAKLQYGDGSFVMASDGDRLPSGLRVVAVKQRHIVLSEGKAEIVLPLLFAKADKGTVGQSPVMSGRVMAAPVDSAGPIIGRNPGPPPAPAR